MKRALSLSILVTAILGAPGAWAQATDSAAAQGIFDEAKQLVAQGRLVDACPRFLASFKLDPKPGTAVNLADCYEKTGQIASAWARYLEAASLAQRAGQVEREQYAKEHAAALYWTLASGSVAKVALGGGSVTTLTSGLSQPSGIAVDATSVYWTNNTGNTVMKMPLGGGSPTTLASGTSTPFAITVDATTVYWTSFASANGPVSTIPRGGGSVSTLGSAAVGSVIYGVAVDATSVYWTNASDGTVMKAPLGGGSATMLASGQDPFFIVVDATSVYWTNSSGTVMKVAK